MKKIKVIYSIIEVILTILAIIGGVFLGFQGKEFYYIFNSLIFLASPLLALLFILFIEIKKIDFTRNQYTEAYFVILMIGGSLLLWLFAKLELNLKIIYWYIFSLILFVAITVVFIFMAKKHKNEPKNGPKFIANR